MNKTVQQHFEAVEEPQLREALLGNLHPKCANKRVENIRGKTHDTNVKRLLVSNYESKV